MRTWLGLIALATLLVAAPPVPRCTSVDPDSGKSGDVISAKGENLSKASVAQIFLTDGQKDTVAAITEQTYGEIKFKIPALAPGRYHVLTLNADRSAIIEQPVVFTVQ